MKQILDDETLAVILSSEELEKVNRVIVSDDHHWCKVFYQDEEPKHGKWIRITQGADPGIYMCPFCHRTIENYGVESLLSIRYPYCHCGARMDEEQNE